MQSCLTRMSCILLMLVHTPSIVLVCGNEIIGDQKLLFNFTGN